MPVHPPYTDPTIVWTRPRASSDFEALGSTHRATDAKPELVEMGKFFGSLTIIYMLAGLGIVLSAHLVE